MVILRDGKATAGIDVQEGISERSDDATTRGDEMEDRVAGLEAQLTEVKAMLQLLVGRTMQNTPSLAAPESVPERGEPSFLHRHGKEPAGTSAPAGAMENQNIQSQTTEATNVFWGNMKLEAKIEIPEYRGELDGEKLDTDPGGSWTWTYNEFGT